ncbi:MAG: ATP-binding protein [Candidatus Koribacter versatilis]|uniref:ATP-binding protein n=1 Tax=Candidatus Korobacter versatilis TaxID=658062 RepID=A0A932A7C3_9BACT|nr:ATP-binding protein [Candidatus Koribacter versatilis]
MAHERFPEWEFDPKSLLVKVDVSIAADLDHINDVVDGVLAMMKVMQCGCGREFQVETALRESLANAIIHGCERDPGKKVQCTVACDNDRGMLIVVRDPGPGFDPAALPSPLHAENLFADHGRGIFMINQLMDGVSHHESGTEIRMRVKGGKECSEAEIFWKN